MLITCVVYGSIAVKLATQIKYHMMGKCTYIKKFISEFVLTWSIFTDLVTIKTTF